MSFWHNPFILTAVGSGLATLTASCLLFRARSATMRVVWWLAVMTCALPAVFVYAMFHPELIDPRFSTYKKFYGDLHAGMTRQEVFAAMEYRYPANGPRLRPKLWSDHADDLCFFMDPEPPEHEPNCEGIFLTLHEGRVVKKAYGAD